MTLNTVSHATFARVHAVMCLKSHLQTKVPITSAHWCVNLLVVVVWFRVL